jgi:hypothetical protein
MFAWLGNFDYVSVILKVSQASVYEDSCVKYGASGNFFTDEHANVTEPVC